MYMVASMAECLYMVTLPHLEDEHTSDNSFMKGCCYLEAIV